MAEIQIGDGSGNDSISSFGGDDVLLGLDGNDFLAGAGGSDTLLGGNGDDYLIVFAGSDDLMVGGAGDDLLQIGGSQSTTIAYQFDATSTTISESFADWLPDSMSLGSLTQSQFAQQYTAWLNHLVATYHDSHGFGADLDGDGVIRVSMNQNDPAGLPTIEGVDASAFFDGGDSITVKTGKITQTRYYADGFTLDGGQSLTSGDGHDDIWGFVTGDSKLLFLGASAATFADDFTVTVADFNNDSSLDTLITLKDSTDWSVLLENVSNFDAARDVIYELPGGGGDF